METGRRKFLGTGMAVGSSLVFGCSEDDARNNVPDRTPDASNNPAADAGFADSGSSIDAGHVDAGLPADSGVTPDAGQDPMCPDPFAGGTQVGQLSFVGENRVPLDRLFNEGWDGRLYTDLRNLDEDDPVISNELHFVRTRFPDLLTTTQGWEIEVSGLADPAILRMSDLEPFVSDQGLIVLECSGNGRGGAFGLLGAARWGGAPIEDVFGLLNINPSATHVEFSGFDEHSVPSAGGHSTPGASWIYTLDQLRAAGAFLATTMNGVPLPPDHGEPVRLMVPGWYGCCNIKWVNSIRFVDDSERSTSQMREFASRTHQPGVPNFARDYIPATMDQAAMPVRFEKWQLGGSIVYRIVGVMWGGYELTDKLQISFNRGARETVNVCPAQETNRTWTIWSHLWQPTRTGDYAVRMHIDDRNIRTRRLDSGFYERVIRVDEV